MTGSEPAAHALFVGAHPDDVEIACGGTILHLIAQGLSAVVVDATRGEAGSRGTQETRDKECAAASTLLGLTKRINLGLPDAAITVTRDAIGALVAEIRRWRPSLLFGPVADDFHPDHLAAAELSKQAWFLSGVAKAFPDAGPAHRPKLLLRYPGNHPITATACLDITPWMHKKVAVVRAYATQVDVADRKHLTRKLDLLERMKVRDAWMGHQIGCAAAEGYVTDGPLPLGQIASLMAL